MDSKKTKKTKKTKKKNKTNSIVKSSGLSSLSIDTKELFKKIKKKMTNKKQEKQKDKNKKSFNNDYKIPKILNKNDYKLKLKQTNHNRVKQSKVKQSKVKQSKVKQSKSNYITTLIDKYYDNDKVTKEYMNTAHKHLHIFPKQTRVIVFGDIHGDLEAAIDCFILAGCISKISIPKDKSVTQMNLFFKHLRWTGKDTYVVQLGDQIDRVRPQKWDHNDITRDNAYKDEGSTLEILYLFYYLNELAKEQGGRVFSIIGNHEIMNIEADFRYVSLKEFKSFKQHLTKTYDRTSKFPYHSKTLKNNSYKLSNSIKKNNTYNTNEPSDTFTKVPEGFRERLYAFSPTGLCSNLIGSNNYVLLQIGNWLFCHGSPVLNTIKKYHTDLINNIVSMYLLGIDTEDKYIEKHYNNIANSKHNESILWNRDFGELEINSIKDKELSHQLDTILNEYNKKNNLLDTNTNTNSTPIATYTNSTPIATHIAIGHTTQFSSNKGINSICNNRVWRCDVGMSRAFGHRTNEPYRQPQVLEILNNDNGDEKIKILI